MTTKANASRIDRAMEQIKAARLAKAEADAGARTTAVRAIVTALIACERASWELDEARGREEMIEAARLLLAREQAACYGALDALIEESGS